MERQQFNFDLMAIQAKGELPDGWDIYRWEAKNHGTPFASIEFTGGVGRPLKSGKRKGQITWRDMDPSTEISVSLTRRELLEFREQWASETGICHQCHGNGTRWHGWSAVDGNRYKHCEYCDGTGDSRAPAHSKATGDRTPRPGGGKE
ncbi:hypothetical protein AB3Y40_06630 [Yoonia sp. R2331]|uniref:hypothetical protein n=1 Tax=Yoonia sp. R2331 TaxID=3237238 RepID=UPI0034E54BCD